MTQELVSIVMPSYNCSQYVGASIDGILCQTYQNWELLITDDCSSDGTVEILKQYAEKDSRIRLFLMTDNMGAGYSRNRCISEARGRYIAFCDSDDVWLPEKLEKQLKFMEERQCCLAYSSYFTCDEDGEQNGIVIAPEQVTLADMKHDNKIGFLTSIYDTQLCPKQEMPVMRKRQDWAYLLRILQHCGTAYALSEPLAIYRMRHNSISRKKISLICYNAAVYSEVFGYSKFHAFAYLFTVFMPTFMWKRFVNALNNYRYKYLWQRRAK